MRVKSVEEGEEGEDFERRAGVEGSPFQLCYMTPPVA